MFVLKEAKQCISEHSLHILGLAWIVKLLRCLKFSLLGAMFQYIKALTVQHR